MPKFPREFLVETTPQPTRYVLADAYYVLPGPVEDRHHGDVVFHLEEDRLTVYRKSQAGAPPESPGGPVYRIGDDGPLAVPSGRVFVRFAEDQSIEEHRTDIADAGFRIVETLSYAPQAGWCEARSGDIADVIGGFAALERIPGIAAVEPQMLLERHARP